MEGRGGCGRGGGCEDDRLSVVEFKVNNLEWLKLEGQTTL